MMANEKFGSRKSARGARVDQMAEVMGLSADRVELLRSACYCAI